MLKETIRTSKKVNGLSDFLFRIWIYLITYVDDYGRGSADPEILKGFVFPRKKGITEQQIEEALHSLANSGMIILYESEGEPFFYFPNWEKHQQIRAKKSRFPVPEPGSILQANPSELQAPDINGYQMISDDIICARNPIQSNMNTNTNPNTKVNSRARARETAQPEEKDPDGFEAFWEAYPRKTGDIREAYFAYTEALKTGVTKEELIAAAEAKHKNTAPEDFKFIPAAEKWLNNKGWLEKEPTKKPKSRYFTTAEESERITKIDSGKLGELEEILKTMPKKAE
jgi:hypothetical protein